EVMVAAVHTDAPGGDGERGESDSLPAPPPAPVQPSKTEETTPVSSGQSAPDFCVSEGGKSGESPRVGNDTLKTQQVINPQSLSPGGQMPVPTRGQNAKKRPKSAPKSTTKKAMNKRRPQARKSAASPPVPDGFEPRQRDNRWQLFKLLGKKLSSKGKT